MHEVIHCCRFLNIYFHWLLLDDHPSPWWVRKCTAINHTDLSLSEQRIDIINQITTDSPGVDAVPINFKWHQIQMKFITMNAVFCAFRAGIIPVALIHCRVACGVWVLVPLPLAVICRISNFGVSR